MTEFLALSLSNLFEAIQVLSSILLDQEL